MSMFGFTKSSLPSYYNEMCSYAKGLYDCGVSVANTVSGGMLGELHPRAVIAQNVTQEKTNTLG